MELKKMKKILKICQEGGDLIVNLDKYRIWMIIFRLMNEEN